MGREGADSTEFNAATSEPCIVFMPEVSKTQMGGTMRLGARKTLLQTPDCKTARLYAPTPLPSSFPLYTLNAKP